MMDFKTKLRKLRENKGISQTAAANEMGLSRQSLCNYENGIREPDIETIRMIANYYQVSVDELFDVNAPERPFLEPKLIELAKTIDGLHPDAKKLVLQQIEIFAAMNK